MDVKLVVEKGSKKQGEIRLKSEDTIIGRRAGCDLRIPSASVRRRHCRRSLRDDCLMVEDLQSANGTYVNGVRITDTHIVRPGDRREVGPVTFLVQYQLSPAARDLLKDDVPELEVEEIVPELEIDEIEGAEAEKKSKRKKKRKKTIVEPNTAKKKPIAAAPDEKNPDSKKPPEKPLPPSKDAEEEQAIPLAFDESTWHMPPGENIRDILSQTRDS